MHPLYLTKSEQATFQKLPDSVCEGWNVEPETGTAYENEAVLKMRARMANFDDFPGAKHVVKMASNAKKFDAEMLKGIEPQALYELCFTLGAVGITAMIQTILGDAKTDKDLYGIASFSLLRHELLATNSSISFR